MFFNQLLLRFSQLIGFAKRTRNPLPLILDLLKLQRESYIAENDQGHRISIRPGTGERFAFYENLIRFDYLKNGVSLKKGDFVIDIGANIGCFTVLAASLVGDDGQVIAIEPDPETYQQLLSNIQINNLHNVTALNIAVTSENTPITLNVSPNSLYTSIYTEIDDKYLTGKTITVDGRTLTSLIDQLQIKEIQLLKMDCEGAEYNILASLDENISCKIKQISMEVHKIPEHDPKEIEDSLMNLGFKLKKQYPLFAFRD
jgi:FkbM family methyltransferase